MNVICIDNSNSAGLTKDNIYKVLNNQISRKWNGYYILNDLNTKIFYRIDRFENLREYNLRKLEL